MLTDERISELFNEWFRREKGGDTYADCWNACARAIEAEVRAEAQEPVNCPHCDGTGDVHSPDGEWRGECNCGAPQEPAKSKFDRLMGDEKETPVERLRFFCSLAMSGQDWIDVEPFFDALTAPQPPTPCPKCADGMVDVTKEDANNYCRILTLLGMEEEGSPVEEVERLISLREGMTCADCNDTGWLENREEGLYPCTCMTEAEPYQLLQAKVSEQSAEIERLARYESAFNEWIEKSEWVQQDEKKLFYGMLGRHRADCMRIVIERQAERIAELESSLEIEKGQFEIREEENRILFARCESQAALIEMAKPLVEKILETALPGEEEYGIAERFLAASQKGSSK